LAFDKQHGTLRILDEIPHSFESLQCSAGEIAKDLFCPRLAAQAAFNDVQSIWCKHNHPTILVFFSSTLSEHFMSHATSAEVTRGCDVDIHEWVKNVVAASRKLGQS